MSEPLIEDDEFWQGVVDAADCILPGRVIETICTALDRRAAPDEASHAPAPISEETIAAALDASVADGETVRFYLEQAVPVAGYFDATCQRLLVEEIVRTVLAQSQGGQPAGESGPTSCFRFQPVLKRAVAAAPAGEPQGETP